MGIVLYIFKECAPVLLSFLLKYWFNCHCAYSCDNPQIKDHFLGILSQMLLCLWSCVLNFLNMPHLTLPHACIYIYINIYIYISWAVRPCMCPSVRPSRLLWDLITRQESYIASLNLDYRYIWGRSQTNSKIDDLHLLFQGHVTS